MTVNASPGPSKTSWGGLRPAAGSLRTRPRPRADTRSLGTPAGTGVVTARPSGSSTSRISAGVPSCTGEPSPTSTRTMASPSRRTGISSGCSTCARRLDVLVAPGQVHPEQHAAELRVASTLLDLVGADRLRMPRASPRPEREQRPLGQPSPLDRSARAPSCDRCWPSPAGRTRGCRSLGADASCPCPTSRTVGTGPRARG